jgi:tRNA G18 (ribose-2'-O)-methylase SpoU
MGSPHFDTDLSGRVAIVLGNEAHGLGPEPADSLDDWVHIPLSGGVESLNVAMAGAVLCFEAVRQQTSGS